MKVCSIIIFKFYGDEKDGETGAKKRSGLPTSFCKIEAKI